MKQKTTLLLLLLCMSYNAFAQCYSSSRSSFETIIVRQTDGTLWSKGYNLYATMGDGTTTSSSSFVQIGTGNNWTDNYSINHYHALAIKTDGTLWSWGTDNGQLGIGTTATAGNPVLPTQVGTDVNWTAVATGLSHSLAIKSDGTLWAWGYNGDGQLGINSADIFYNALAPIQVGTDNNWVKIFADYLISFGIKNDGTLWSWGGGSTASGDGHYGLGYVDSGTDYLIPHQIGTATNWATVAPTYDFTAAIKTDGTLWVWGHNSNALFGNNTPIGTLTTNILPIQLGTDANWKDVKLSNSNVCLALKTNRTRWGWGHNNYGYSLGNGTNIDLLVPTQLDTATDWLYIDFDNTSTVGSGVKLDHSLYRWGNPYHTALNLQIPTLEGTPCTLSNTNYNYVNDIQVFPNPVNNIGVINYTAKESSIATLTIFNSVGQDIFSDKKLANIGNNQLSIEFSNYSSGIYYIKLQIGNYNYSTKFIKQ